jgi:hypothetical protein
MSRASSRRSVWLLLGQTVRTPKSILPSVRPCARLVMACHRSLPFFRPRLTWISMILPPARIHANVVARTSGFCGNGDRNVLRQPVEPAKGRAAGHERSRSP